jgi:hypothetical protein
MNPRLVIVLVVVAAIVLALAGWAVQGIRWLLGGWAPRRTRLATA